MQPILDVPAYSGIHSSLSSGTVLFAVDSHFLHGLCLPHAPALARLSGSFDAVSCLPWRLRESLSPLCATRVAPACPACPSARVAAMARKKKTGAAAQSGPQSAEWVQSAASGFDAAYRVRPSGQLPSAEESARAVSAVGPPVVAGTSSGSAGSTEVPLSQARLGSVMLHRQSGEGLTATGFEPERHSVMVLGRPVQARQSMHSKRELRRPFLLLLSVPSIPSLQASPHGPLLPRATQSSCAPSRSATRLRLRHAEPFAACPAVASCDSKLCVLALWSCRCQALLLSHEGATGHELEPYFQQVVKPLDPLVLYGRFERRDPPCHKQECVYYCWRDRRCFAESVGQ